MSFFLLFVFVFAETLWFCNLLILWYNFHTLGKLLVILEYFISIVIHGFDAYSSTCKSVTSELTLFVFLFTVDACFLPSHQIWDNIFVWQSACSWKVCFWMILLITSCICDSVICFFQNDIQYHF